MAMVNTRLIRDAHRSVADRQAGFTMVETLVALVVLAIGLLGIAALYLDSLRAGRTAIYRSQAVTLAADMADRMRANRTAVLSYETAIDASVSAPATNCDDPAAPCDAATIANVDLFTWKEDVARALPEGRSGIDVTAPLDPADPATYVITIEWSDVGDAAPLRYELRIQA